MLFLPQGGSNRTLTDLALTLTNLSGLYLATNRTLRAAESCKEAMAIFQSLAAASREAREQDYAMSIQNCALIEMKSGHYSDAEKLFENALEIQRRLVQQHPGQFRDQEA